MNFHSLIQFLCLLLLLFQLDTIKTAMNNNGTNPGIQAGLFRVVPLYVFKNSQKTIIQNFHRILFIFCIPEAKRYHGPVKIPVQFFLGLTVAIFTTFDDGIYVLSAVKQSD